MKKRPRMAQFINQQLLGLTPVNIFCCKLRLIEEKKINCQDSRNKKVLTKLQKIELDLISKRRNFAVLLVVVVAITDVVIVAVVLVFVVIVLVFVVIVVVAITCCYSCCYCSSCCCYHCCWSCYLCFSCFCCSRFYHCSCSRCCCDHCYCSRKRLGKACKRNCDRGWWYSTENTFLPPQAKLFHLKMFPNFSETGIRNLV